MSQTLALTSSCPHTPPAFSSSMLALLFFSGEMGEMGEISCRPALIQGSSFPPYAFVFPPDGEISPDLPKNEANHFPRIPTAEGVPPSFWRARGRPRPTYSGGWWRGVIDRKVDVQRLWPSKVSGHGIGTENGQNNSIYITSEVSSRPETCTKRQSMKVSHLSTRNGRELVVISHLQKLRPITGVM